MLKAVIVDDEYLARSILKSILNEHCPEVSIVGEAEEVISAVELIKDLKPDMVFIDIEMPEFSGFQLLDHFDEIDFKIVFCTAHEEYALKAFDVSATDYVLKPIQIESVKRAVSKVLYLKETSFEKDKSINFDINRPQKIGIPITGGLLFVDKNEIIFLEADGAYSKVFLTDNRKHLVSKKLKIFEDLLLEEGVFFRSHRSYLLNVNHVKQFVRKDGGTILMDNDIEVLLSKEKRDEFFEIFGGKLI
jgi:two-component system, LytTR family, response regulator